MSDIEGKAARVAASKAGAERVSMDTNRHECSESDIRVPSSVIPSEVENRVARDAARWTGRPEVERAGSERIKSLDISVSI
jgi:hypothetical protein